MPTEVVVWPKLILPASALEAFSRGVPAEIEPCYLMTGRELNEVFSSKGPVEMLFAAVSPEEWEWASS
jgi:hypothetical protein